MSSALNFDPWIEIRDLRRGAAKAAKVAKSALRPSETEPAQVRPLPPTAADLVYSLETVRKELPLFPAWAKELHSEWVEIYTEGGWSAEQAERAALRRVLRNPGPKGPWRFFRCRRCGVEGASAQLTAMDCGGCGVAMEALS